MAVFRIERTRELHRDEQPPPARQGAVAEIQGTAFHDAVLAGGLELYHTRPGEDLQGRRGCHRRGAAGAGERRVHCPPPDAGPPGAHLRHRVRHLRAAPTQSAGYAPAGYGFTRYGKPVSG